MSIISPLYFLFGYMGIIKIYNKNFYNYGKIMFICIIYWYFNFLKFLCFNIVYLCLFVITFFIVYYYILYLFFIFLFILLLVLY